MLPAIVFIYYLKEYLILTQLTMIHLIIGRCQIRRRTATSCAFVHEVEVLYGGIESFTY